MDTTPASASKAKKAGMGKAKEESDEEDDDDEDDDDEEDDEEGGEMFQDECLSCASALSGGETKDGLYV